MSSKVIFKYKNKTKEIECNQYMALKWIFERFAKEINLDINTLSFKYNNKKINGGLSFKNQINEKDKPRNIINIEVYDDNNKPKIQYNNKTETKTKEPNLKKLDMNLSNKKIINKTDNNKNIKKIKLIYKNDYSIKLFNDSFVIKNKDKCKMIYKGKEIELKEFISPQNEKNKEIEIILEIFDNIVVNICFLIVVL